MALIDPSTGPLRDLVVLDFGQAAVGPISAEYLGMLGATVIKVEAPKGDLVRRLTPLIGGTGTTYIGNNLTKRGVVVDLKTPAGLERAKHLIANADVLIENFRSYTIMERLGLGYEVMASVNPRLIYLQSSAFGREGPWVGMFSNEWVAQTVSGFVSVTGNEAGLPEWSRATANLDWNGAMMNLVTVLAALIRREQTGRGMMIETAQLGSSIFAGITRFAELFANGQTPRPMGSGRPNIVPDQAFKTADGYVNVSVPKEKFWAALRDALRDPALNADRFASNESRIAHRDELIAVLSRIFERRGSAEWINELNRAGVPCGIHERDRHQSDVLLDDEQVRANSMMQRVATPYGEIRSQSPHWKFEKTPADINRGSPLLGQHTDFVFAALANPEGCYQATGNAVGSHGRETGQQTRGVLHGLRVLEIAEGVPGPLSAMMLRRLGAEVTKVEPPQGDWLRAIPPMVNGESALFRQLNPAKQRLTVDLNTAAGREEVARLADKSDVVIVGYRPGKLERLGISYNALKRNNPRLVYCEINGWGTKGPMANLPATELAVQAMAGLTRHLGTRNGPPVRQGFDMVSVTTGIAATQAILAALFWRMRTGEGQRVEVSMLATAIAINQWDVVAESETVEMDRPSPGMQLESYEWPSDHGFRCANGSCLIDFLGREEAWSLFLAAIGREELLGDPRFNTTALIRNNKRLLPGLLNSTLRTWPLERLELVVREYGGSILPVLELAQAVSHPQAVGLGIVVQEAGQPIPMIRIPLRCTDALQDDQVDLGPAERTRG